MNRFGDHLRSVVSASAAPYGYTLTIWTTGSVTTHELGTPNGWRALLFLAGAIAGFALTAGAAHRGAGTTFAESDKRSVRVWGAFHLLPIGLAIGASALISSDIRGVSAWPIVGFAATAIYLFGLAIQFTFADRADAIERGDSLDAQ